MILVVNVCSEKLHYLEFVKPVEDILEANFFTRHYLELTKSDLAKADKVIVCGTSLKDNLFLERLESFDWMRDFGKPLLGICAGFQLVGLTYGCKLEKELEIGYFHENFEKDFLGLRGEVEVYHLHNNYVEFNKDFEIFSSGEIAQAVRHKSREIYGTLFHPEVRNKEMILNFVKLT